MATNPPQDFRDDIASVIIAALFELEPEPEISPRHNQRQPDRPPQARGRAGFPHHHHESAIMKRPLLRPVALRYDQTGEEILR